MPDFASEHIEGALESVDNKVKKTAAAVPLLTKAALKAETDIFQAIIETTTTTVTKVLHGQQFPDAPPVLSKLNLSSLLV